MNSLFKGLRNTFIQIKNRKIYFVLLILFQMFLMIIFMGVILFYGLKIVGNINEITATLEKDRADSNQKNLQQQALQEAYAILTTYSLLKQNLWNLLIGLVATFLTLQLSMWIISYHFLNPQKITWRKRLSSFFQQWLKYAFTLIIFFIPFFVMIYFTLNKAISMNITPESFTALLRLLFYLFITIYFFLLVAFASIGFTSWKKYFQFSLFLLTKKVHYCLLLFIIQTVLISIILIPVYFTMANEDLFDLSLVMLFLLNLVLVLNRLWWISSLQEGSKEHLAKEQNTNKK